MTHPRRVEPPLSPAFKKDPTEEQFLDHLNSVLAPYNKQEYHECEEQFPTLYIVGVARSGTTLLHQLIADNLDLGYINNLIAAFWRAPLYGIRLSQKLLPELSPLSFESRFGRTREIYEPHEFGYFWSELLKYQEPQQRDALDLDPVDWHYVRKVMNNISNQFGKPIVYKSLYMSWHIEHLARVLPTSCFIHIRRDPAENAASILKCRQEFSGSVNNWVSLRPLEYNWLKQESPSVQAVGQVYYIERAMEQQFEKIDRRNVLSISYDQLCQRPSETLSLVQNLLRQNGSEVRLRKDPPKAFGIRSSLSQSNSEVEIRAAMQRFYSEVGND